MSKLDKIIVLAFVLAVITGVVGFLGMAPPFVFAPSIYASGYSEAAFDKIEVGDSEETVLKILGEPLVRHDGQSRRVWLDYSQDSWALWFQLRRIALSNSVVVEKISMLNTD